MMMMNRKRSVWPREEGTSRRDTFNPYIRLTYIRLLIKASGATIMLPGICLPDAECLYATVACAVPVCDETKNLAAKNSMINRRSVGICLGTIYKRRQPAQAQSEKPAALYDRSVS